MREKVKIQEKHFFNYELLKKDSSHHLEFLAHNYDDTYNRIFFFSIISHFWSFFFLLLFFNWQKWASIFLRLDSTKFKATLHNILDQGSWLSGLIQFGSWAVCFVLMLASEEGCCHRSVLSSGVVCFVLYTTKSCLIRPMLLRSRESLCL